MMLLPSVLNPTGGLASAVKEMNYSKVHIAVIPTYPVFLCLVEPYLLCSPPRSPVSPHAAEELQRPRVPLIVLAQQGQYQPDYYPAPQHLHEVDPNDVPSGFMSPDRHSRLSTITELTERTEPSSHWPSRQQLVAMNNPRALSSSETISSYGKVIGESHRMRLRAVPLIHSQSAP